MTENILEIRNVAKRFTLVELERLVEFAPQKVFRRIVAVRDVSLTVTPGQVYGFLGPNGAGKTTTIKMCMDLIRPSAGDIKLFGRPPRDPEVKRRVGYLPEHPYFYDYLTAIADTGAEAKMHAITCVDKVDCLGPARRVGDVVVQTGGQLIDANQASESKVWATTGVSLPRSSEASSMSMRRMDDEDASAAMTSSSLRVCSGPSNRNHATGSTG